MATENFTVGWAETDPGNKLSQTSTTATFAGLLGNTETNFLQVDKGASFITGNFKFRLTATVTAASHENNSKVRLLVCTNTAFAEFSENSPGFQLRWTSDDTTNTNPILSLDYWAAGNTLETPTTSDTYKGVAVGIGTTFYVEVERATLVLTAKIYSDAGFTTLVDTLTVNETTSASFLRYFITTATWYVGAGTTISGSVSNLDLAFSGADVTAPSFTAGPSYQNVTNTTFQITGTSNESGTAKLIVTAPSASQPSDATFDGSTETTSITAATPFVISHS